MCTEGIRKWSDGCWRDVAADLSLTIECRQKAEMLLERSKLIVFIHLDPDGLPVAKAMLAAVKKGLRQIWFSTNSSSEHVHQVRRNPCATVYFCDPEIFEGVMLAGRAQEEADRTWRETIWQDGCEQYYSGVDDPDYCVLRFDAAWANYYRGGMNVTFAVEPPAQ